MLPRTTEMVVPPIIVIDELNYSEIGSGLIEDPAFWRFVDWATFLSDNRLAHVVLASSLDVADVLERYPGFRLRRQKVYLDFPRPASVHDYFHRVVNPFMRDVLGAEARPPPPLPPPPAPPPLAISTIVPEGQQQQIQSEHPIGGTSAANSSSSPPAVEAYSSVPQHQTITAEAASPPRVSLWSRLARLWNPRAAAAALAAQQQRQQLSHAEQHNATAAAPAVTTALTDLPAVEATAGAVVANSSTLLKGTQTVASDHQSSRADTVVIAASAAAASPHQLDDELNGVHPPVAAPAPVAAVAPTQEPAADAEAVFPVAAAKAAARKAAAAVSHSSTAIAESHHSAALHHHTTPTPTSTLFTASAHHQDHAPSSSTAVGGNQHLPLSNAAPSTQHLVSAPVVAPQQQQQQQPAAAAITTAPTVAGPTKAMHAVLGGEAPDPLSPSLQQQQVGETEKSAATAPTSATEREVSDSGVTAILFETTQSSSNAARASYYDAPQPAFRVAATAAAASASAPVASHTVPLQQQQQQRQPPITAAARYPDAAVAAARAVLAPPAYASAISSSSSSSTAGADSAYFLLEQWEIDRIVETVGGHLKDLDSIVTSVLKGKSWGAALDRLVADSVEAAERILDDILHSESAGNSSGSSSSSGNSISGKSVLSGAAVAVARANRRSQSREYTAPPFDYDVLPRPDRLTAVRSIGRKIVVAIARVVSICAL